MPSKYDNFWISIIDEIHQKILDAIDLNQVTYLDVQSVANYGSRQSWYGNVEISNGEIIDSNMAHARSLGKVILKQPFRKDFSDVKIKFTISESFQLAITVIKDSHHNGQIDKVYDETVDSIYSIDTIYSMLERFPLYDHSYRTTDLPSNGIYFFYEKDELIDINGTIQDRIVRVGTHNADGRLKGRIRSHYRGNKNSSVFRMHVGSGLIKKHKIKNVNLQQWMKHGTPTDEYVEDLIDKTFKDIFKFRCIRVDSKKDRLSKEKALITILSREGSSPSKSWLGRFAEKAEIRYSGLWNVQHIENMKNQKNRRNKLMENLKVSLVKPKKHKLPRPVKSEKLHTKSKILCFIQCCKSKAASGEIIRPELNISSQDLPNTFSKLMRGRELMQSAIDYDSLPTTAINIYTGSPYNIIQPYHETIINMIRSGRIKLVIISAGYGVVDALEPINNYNAEMIRGKNGAADIWKDMDLTDIIADLMFNKDPSCIYGFFPGETKWSSPSAKYRYFFTEGLKLALNKGLKPDSYGCFYREEGRGVKAILGSLGRTFIEFINSNFDNSYVKAVQQNSRRDGKVIIGFDPVT